MPSGGGHIACTELRDVVQDELVTILHYNNVAWSVHPNTSDPDRKKLYPIPTPGSKVTVNK